MRAWRCAGGGSARTSPKAPVSLHLAPPSKGGRGGGHHLPVMPHNMRSLVLSWEFLLCYHACLHSHQHWRIHQASMLSAAQHDGNPLRPAAMCLPLQLSTWHTLTHSYRSPATLTQQHIILDIPRATVGESNNNVEQPWACPPPLAFAAPSISRT